MTTEVHTITVGELAVEVVRKNIKNLHLGVYPPAGRVRIAAPLALSDEAVRLAVIRKLGWIKKHRAAFAAQARQSERAMVSGESHYLWGQPYRLRLHAQAGPPTVVVRGTTWLDLYAPPEATPQRREAIVHAWYRAQLKAAIPPLLERWQPVMGVAVAAWGVKRMRTRWGSCNSAARRIWLNLELAKKPPRCLEYVVVHELAHLLERRHNAHFTALMDRYLPHWRTLRDELNAAPLGHEHWSVESAHPQQLLS